MDSPNKDVASRLGQISFRQLNLLETVGRIQSLRRASEECNQSQPAVTQAVAKLERQLDVQLLDRRSSGSYLTELGQVFHRRVSRFFRQYHDALKNIPVTGGKAVIGATAMRITRSQTRSLIALVESGALDRAAISLGINQPSLQRAVRALERNVMIPIICRTTAGVSITPAGMEFGKRMKIALQEIEMGWREMEIARGKSQFRVTVGVMALGGSALLGATLDRFVRRYPGVEVKVLPGVAYELLYSLAAGDVDFVVGLVNEMPELDLEYEEIAKTPYHIVCRKGHRLTKQSHIDVADLLACEWIIGAREASRSKAFERLFDATPKPAAPIRTNALPVIMHLLRDSDRLTLMTNFELSVEEQGLRKLAFGPIKPVPSIGIMTRSGWLPTVVQGDLMELIRKRASEVSEYFLSIAV